MKILIATDNGDLRKMLFHEEVIGRLNEIGTVEWLEEPDTLGEVIGGYDACITTWGSPRLTPEILDKASRLKFIGHAAGTVVPYVDECVFERNIVVVNANQALSMATAEGAVAMMTAGAYSLPMYEKRLREGGWSDNDRETVMGISGRTIGLIGWGDISREVVRLLQPYHAHILLYSSHCSQEEAGKRGIQVCSLEELLKRSDIVSIHNTLTASTRGMIGKRELGLMKEQALLVNTARGPVIQEEALTEALREGRIHAVLDVYNEEPLSSDHPFRKCPNVILYPHIAAFAGYWKRQLAVCVVGDLERMLRGEAVTGRIDRDKYRRMTPC